jgi:NADH-quinone oxidoreductase subunit G
MPTLTIDNRTVNVPDGTNVLEAAKQLGIVIPHFCYHEALGAVGACRLCAMTFLDGPVKGVQMSCMVEAKDGMVVSTLEPAAVDLRKHVIEWLMVNHPHDCPVCDEGGECQLQDMTVAGGHGIRRYRGRKKTYNNQELGPFICHEMNRCIQCYRCVRTYQDYCGGTDFGVLGCNQRIYFGRFRDGRLESPFSGNIVDACPTGVFTDKTFRFQSRYWDLEEAPSVCPHCSLGCAVIPGARYRELQRVRGGVNRVTNGFFICDRGRFGYGHANHPDRPRIPRIARREASWPEAAAAARERLAALVEKHGPGALALLGSPRATLEANAVLLNWAGSLGTRNIVFDCNPGRDHSSRVVAALAPAAPCSQEEVRRSDFILLIGADPVNEGAMLAVAVRQAVRNGAAAAVLDPRPVQLPCRAGHLQLPPERLAEALKAIAEGDFTNFSRQQAAYLESVGRRLRQAERPVLIGGADLLGAAGVEQLFATAGALTTAARPCRTAVLQAGPNSYGGGMLAPPGSPAFDGILEEIAAGRIKGLVCLASNPFGDFPDPGKAREILARLELLIVLDCLPTTAVVHADIFLPITVPAEQAGTFVNQEGRMLPFSTVFDPGVPIRITGEGDHPPRIFEPGTPGELPRPDWAALCALQKRTVSLKLLRREMEEADRRFTGITGLAGGHTGLRVAAGGKVPEVAQQTARSPEESGVLRLLAVQDLFGSEILAAFSPVLDPVRPAPRVLLAPGDAAHLGVAEGERVRLVTATGTATAAVQLVPGTPPGLVMVPSLRGTPLEIFLPGSGIVDCRLEKEEGGA